MPKRNRVVTNTLNGGELTKAEVDLISLIANIADDEKIELIYNRNNKFEPQLKIDKQHIVCITNRRVFQIKNNKLDEWAKRKFIRIVYHIKKNIFKPDIFKCETSGGEAEFQIYHRSACGLFFNYLQTHSYID